MSFPHLEYLKSIFNEFLLPGMDLTEHLLDILPLFSSICNKTVLALKPTSRLIKNDVSILSVQDEPGSETLVTEDGMRRAKSEPKSSCFPGREDLCSIYIDLIDKAFMQRVNFHLSNDHFSGSTNESTSVSASQPISIGKTVGGADSFSNNVGTTCFPAPNSTNLLLTETPHGQLLLLSLTHPAIGSSDRMAIYRRLLKHQQECTASSGGLQVSSHILDGLISLAAELGEYFPCSIEPQIERESFDNISSFTTFYERHATTT
ncbi:unnamed protein product [Protopolystoma xenopodis]|uniref:Uncharacterized protein n=1 Tax=Protopolystoma xenopodis TaxID=117903 RepID=A0A3S4ZG12_9PLAT|nr:unnamed protein product [Protopolystoma xenopodis]